MSDIFDNLFISLNNKPKILETSSLLDDLVNDPFSLDNSLTCISDLCITSLNLHSKYSILVTLNLNSFDSRVYLQISSLLLTHCESQSLSSNLQFIVNFVVSLVKINMYKEIKKLTKLKMVLFV